MPKNVAGMNCWPIFWCLKNNLVPVSQPSIILRKFDVHSGLWRSFVDALFKFSSYLIWSKTSTPKAIVQANFSCCLATNVWFRKISIPPPWNVFRFEPSPPPLEFPIKLHTFPYKFWLFRFPSPSEFPMNFHQNWKWAWIFSGTTQWDINNLGEQNVTINWGLTSSNWTQHRTSSKMFILNWMGALPNIYIVYKTRSKAHISIVAIVTIHK